jgi:hypothetical protein
MVIPPEAKIIIHVLTWLDKHYNPCKAIRDAKLVQPIPLKKTKPKIPTPNTYFAPTNIVIYLY